jgi:hypothetical protein
MPDLNDRWDPEPEGTESDLQRYRLRSGRYWLEEAENGSWAVVPPDGVPLAEGLDFESARQMAEKHDVQDTREEVGERRWQPGRST